MGTKKLVFGTLKEVANKGFDVKKMAAKQVVLGMVERGGRIKGVGREYTHHSVNHSAWEYVRGQAHTNGIESFWTLLKRGYHGTYHKMSVKHLHRTINEFSARHNDRQRATITPMDKIGHKLLGKHALC